MRLFLIKNRLLRNKMNLNKEEKRKNGSKRCCYKQINKNRKSKISFKSSEDQVVRKMQEK